MDPARATPGSLALEVANSAASDDFKSLAINLLKRMGEVERDSKPDGINEDFDRLWDAILDEINAGPLVPTGVVAALIYSDRLDELELAPNGDDFNAVMEFLAGAPYREPHTDGR